MSEKKKSEEEFPLKEGTLPTLYEMDTSISDPYKVRVVLSEYLRNQNIDLIEFGIVAIHEDFPDLIPEDEIWLAGRLPTEEFNFIISGAVARLNALKDGYSDDDAYDIGINKEEEEREKVSWRWADTRNDPSQPIIDFTGFVVIPGDEETETDDVDVVRVYLVNADEVRETYKTDFLEGGNGAVYPWIPKDQIWVESDLTETEAPFVVLHEYVERLLMLRRGLDYDKAHELASKLELKYRQRDPLYRQGELMSLNPGVLDEVDELEGKKSFDLPDADLIRVKQHGRGTMQDREHAWNQAAIVREQNREYNLQHPESRETQEEAEISQEEVDKVERERITKSMPLCPVCGANAVQVKDGSGYWRCGKPPCEWSVFAAGADMHMEKAMSWLAAGHGAELVPSPEQPKKKKSILPMSIKGSYFAICPRDERGKCRPKGTRDMTGQNAVDKPTQQLSKREEQKDRPSQEKAQVGGGNFSPPPGPEQQSVLWVPVSMGSLDAAWLQSAKEQATEVLKDPNLDECSRKLYSQFVGMAEPPTEDEGKKQELVSGIMQGLFPGKKSLKGVDEGPGSEPPKDTSHWHESELPSRYEERAVNQDHPLYEEISAEVRPAGRFPKDKAMKVRPPRVRNTRLCANRAGHCEEYDRRARDIFFSSGVRVPNPETKGVDERGSEPPKDTQHWREGLFGEQREQDWSAQNSDMLHGSRLYADREKQPLPPELRKKGVEEPRKDDTHWHGTFAPGYETRIEKPEPGERHGNQEIRPERKLPPENVRGQRGNKGVDEPHKPLSPVTEEQFNQGTTTPHGRDVRERMVENRDRAGITSRQMREESWRERHKSLSEEPEGVESQPQPKEQKRPKPPKAKESSLHSRDIPKAPTLPPRQGEIPTPTNPKVEGASQSGVGPKTIPPQEARDVSGIQEPYELTDEPPGREFHENEEYELTDRDVVWRMNPEEILDQIEKVENDPDFPNRDRILEQLKGELTPEILDRYYSRREVDFGEDIDAFINFIQSDEVKDPAEVEQVLAEMPLEQLQQVASSLEASILAGVAPGDWENLDEEGISDEDIKRRANLSNKMTEGLDERKDIPDKTKAFYKKNVETIFNSLPDKAFSVLEDSLSGIDWSTNQEEVGEKLRSIYPKVPPGYKATAFFSFSDGKIYMDGYYSSKLNISEDVDQRQLWKETLTHELGHCLTLKYRYYKTPEWRKVCEEELFAREDKRSPLSDYAGNPRPDNKNHDMYSECFADTIRLFLSTTIPDKVIQERMPKTYKVIQEMGFGRSKPIKG